MGVSSSSNGVEEQVTSGTAPHGSPSVTRLPSCQALSRLRSLRRTGSASSGASWYSVTLACETLSNFVGSVQERRSASRSGDLTTTTTPAVHCLKSDRLSDLIRLFAEAPQQQPLVVDLGGHVLKGTGLSFTIARGYVALANGGIELPPDAQLVVTGWGVCLLGLAISGHGEPSSGGTSSPDADTAAVRVCGGRVLCERCTVAGGSLSAGVFVEDGGTAVLRNCVLNEKCRYGVVAEGPSSLVCADSSEFRGNTWVAVALQRGARGELSSCLLIAPGHTGVLASNANTPEVPTSAKLDNCLVVACGSYCVHAQGVASCSLENCELADSAMGVAAEAAGLVAAACIIVARQCLLHNHRQLAAWAGSCSHVQLADCVLSGTTKLHGLQASEGGKAVAERCKFTGNAGHGAYARGLGSSIRLRGCVLEGNKGGATGEDDGRVSVEA